MRNDGDANFVESQSFPGAANLAKTADFDGDGDLDTVSFSYTTAQLFRLFLNSGTGSFTLSYVASGSNFN